MLAHFRMYEQLANLKVDAMVSSTRRSLEGSTDPVAMIRRASKWWEDFAAGKEPEQSSCRQDTENVSTPAETKTAKASRPKNDANSCVQGNDPDNQVYAQIQGAQMQRFSLACSVNLTIYLMHGASRREDR